jgi:hypothetical protein
MMTLNISKKGKAHVCIWINNEDGTYISRLQPCMALLIGRKIEILINPSNYAQNYPSFRAFPDGAYLELEVQVR